MIGCPLAPEHESRFVFCHCEAWNDAKLASRVVPGSLNPRQAEPVTGSAEWVTAMTLNGFGEGDAMIPVSDSSFVAMIGGSPYREYLL